VARSRKKKNSELKIDIQIIIILIFSILLSVFVFSESGIVGKTVSEILGGLISWVKYILPIGFFIIAIYLFFNKKDGIKGKLIFYLIMLLLVATILATSEFSNGTFSGMKSLVDLSQKAYDLGTNGIGGGVLGTVIANVFITMGVAGSYILSVGLIIIIAIFSFGLRPGKLIKEAMENAEEKRTLRDKEDEIRKKERELRKKEKFEQLEILDLSEKDEKLKKAGKRYVQDIEEEFEQPKFNIKEPKRNNVEHENLFTEQSPVKEEATKQVLNLDHALTEEEMRYEFPPISLLKEPKLKRNTLKKDLTAIATKLQKTLYSFGVSAKVENISVGPTITRYELKPAEGVRVSKIANLADDIALNLAADTIRIEAPIPGKQAVGIEIPNKEKEMVFLREIIDSSEFLDLETKTAFALGKDAAGEIIVTDISKMPHMLIAGSTGSGKSVCINTLIASIIYKAKPNEVKLVMVDPKVVELAMYNGIPHLLIPVVTDAKKAAGALQWAVQEMVHRYELFAEKGVRDLEGYNKGVQGEGEKLPKIVIIIDELADLMMVAAKEVEDSICRLAQMARAARNALSCSNTKTIC